MLTKATTLSSGNVFIHKYQWNDKGQDNPRTKIAAVSYYAPWDWVIGASCYEEESFAALERTKTRSRMMLLAFALAGFFACLAAGGVFCWFSKALSNRLKTLTTAARLISVGNIDAARSVLLGKAA